MAGRIMKSLWEMLTSKTPITPDANDFVPIAPQPGTPFVTQMAPTTVANLLAGGGAALDIGLRRASVSWTDAETKALTQKTIAVGIANKILQPLVGILKVDFTAGAYTNIDAAAVFVLGSGSTPLAVLAQNSASANETGFTDIFGSAGQDIWMFPPLVYSKGIADLISGNLTGKIQPGDAGDWSPIGADLTARPFNSMAGPLTGGDAANTMTLDVLYWIV